MQSKHRVVPTKNYVLLVNETPVEVVDELGQGRILTGEMTEFIRSQITWKGRARALFETLPRRGPKAFHAFCYALLARKDRPSDRSNGLRSGRHGSVSALTFVFSSGRSDLFKRERRPQLIKAGYDGCGISTDLLENVWNVFGEAVSDARRAGDADPNKLDP